ncbi:hypothetical protein LSUCC0031_04905 [Rhodobacterales bacterium LSUCC0031]|nr:hypothetical protein [Rhodobacterales bacterium LSUCC0031]
MTELAAQFQDAEIVMIDATYAKAHQTASSMALRRGEAGATARAHKRSLNSKLDVLADAKGRLTRMFLSAGQASGCIGTRALLSSIPLPCSGFGIAILTGSAIP